MPPSLHVTVGDIAEVTGGEVDGDRTIEVRGLATLDRAGPDDLSFLAHGRFHSHLRVSKAGAVLVASPLRHLSGGPSTRIVVADAYRAIITVAQRWFPPQPISWGVDPTARIGRGCRWLGRLSVGAGAILGDDVMIGSDCVVGPHTVLATGVRIGDRCRIEAGVTVGNGCVIGDDVTVGSGARLANPGFRYLTDGPIPDPIPHLGHCVIEDHVTIGANTTVDRGTIGDTVVGRNTKIDNLVQIGHNCRIGTACIIMAQVGIAGSTVVEDHAVLAGQAGLADHLVVGRGARVAAQSGVIGNVPPHATVSGYPARNHRAVLRQAAALGRLTPLTTRLERLVADSDRRR